MQHHQHNLREDLTDGTESGDEEDEDEEDDDEEGGYKEDEDEKDQGDQLFSESETNSPKRKRARTAKVYPLPFEYANLTPTTPITFEIFDELPIRARSKSIWNKLFNKNPGFWRTKCEKWRRQLHEAFEAREDVNIFLLPWWVKSNKIVRLTRMLITSREWLMCSGSCAKFKNQFTAQTNGD
jgi:hypothetical protein